MAKVKIFLQPGETLREAEDSLIKAITHHSSGDVHSNEEFSDPAMESIFQKMEKLHSEMYKEMLQEIFEVLDSEYSNGYK